MKRALARGLIDLCCHAPHHIRSICVALGLSGAYKVLHHQPPLCTDASSTFTRGPTLGSQAKLITWQQFLGSEPS